MRKSARSAPITSSMVRYLFAALVVLLALALIVGATHELCHVLAFDWASAAPDATAAAPARLP